MLSAEDQSIEKIQTFAKKKYADKWQHRISDDYILLMKDMGHWAFFSTNLQLKDEQGDSIALALRAKNWGLMPAYEELSNADLDSLYAYIEYQYQQNK